MKVNKTVNLEKFQDLKELLEKLKKNRKIQSLSFHGSIRKEANREIESYSINWIEEEKID